MNYLNKTFDVSGWRVRAHRWIFRRHLWTSKVFGDYFLRPYFKILIKMKYLDKLNEFNTNLIEASFKEFFQEIVVNRDKKSNLLKYPLSHGWNYTLWLPYPPFPWYTLFIYTYVFFSMGVYRWIIQIYLTMVCKFCWGNIINYLHRFLYIKLYHFV